MENQPEQIKQLLEEIKSHTKDKYGATYETLLMWEKKIENLLSSLQEGL